MLDPQHIDFVRRLLVMLGVAGGVWFVSVLLYFYFQEKARRRWH